MKHRIIIINFIILSIVCLPVYGQKPVKKDTVKIPIVLPVIKIGEDTLPLINLQEVRTFPRPRFKNRREYRRYSRYVMNVKKVYPYAKYAAQLLTRMEHHLDSLPAESEKKVYIKQVEKSLRKRYEDDIWNMTFSQGKILIKLIDRETGLTSYEIIDMMKGSFNAIFWQTVARLFGANLKTKFDPQGKDRLLNQIVLMIEYGMI